MPMRVVLFQDSECPPCDDAVEAMKQFIDANEVEVMDIHEGLQQFDLGEPEGVPFLGVISPSTGKCINKIYFQDVGIKEITPEVAEETSAAAPETSEELEPYAETDQG